MDPDEALRRARAAMADAERYGTEIDAAQLANVWERLYLAFGALDQWISKGGFLPDAWTTPTPPDPADGYPNQAIRDWIES